MSDLLRGLRGVRWMWDFLSGLMVVVGPCWRSSIIKEAVLQGDTCHLPTVHTGRFHEGLLWSYKGLERRVVVMPHWADYSLSVCGQSRARDILLILQHTKSKNGANLTGTSTASHHSFRQRLKRSLCSIWFHATGDSFTLCQTNVFFFSFYGFFPSVGSSPQWQLYFRGPAPSQGLLVERGRDRIKRMSSKVGSLINRRHLAKTDGLLERLFKHWVRAA